MPVVVPILYAALTIGVALAYAARMARLHQQWTLYMQVSGRKSISAPVSIVVAARNEQAQIGATLESLCRQDYPNTDWEIIVVDNHSTDTTWSKAVESSCDRVRCFRLGDHLPQDQAFKKEALSFGIQQARYDLIVTTDADCRHQTGWLRALVSALEGQGKALMSGPVHLVGRADFLTRYQEIEGGGLMVVTAGGLSSGSFLSANGANLIFRKSVYDRVGGYVADRHASGDDVSLMQRVAAIEGIPAVGFVYDSEASVQTQTQQSWYGLLQQRKRWASKAGAYSHWSTQAMGVLVWGNALLICLHLSVALLWHPAFVWLALAHMGIKALADWPVLSAGQRFYDSRLGIGEFVLASLIHPWFTVLPGVMLLFSPQYDWKGRRVT